MTPPREPDRYETKARCGATMIEDGYTYGCTLPHRHDGNHRDRDIAEWWISEATRPPAPSPEAPPAKEPCRAEVASRFPEYSHYECELPGGHVGPHSEGGTEWTDATTVVAPPSEPVAAAQMRAAEEFAKASPQARAGDAFALPIDAGRKMVAEAKAVGALGESLLRAEKRIAELEGLLEEAREMVDVLGEGHAADLVARIDAALSRTAAPGKGDG